MVIVELLQNFERDLTIRRRAKRTIQGYSQNVKAFLEYFPEPGEVDTEELEEYLEYLMLRDLSGSTLKNIFSGLSSFYEFLIYKKIVDTNPITGFRKRYLDNVEPSERRQVPKLENVRELIKRLELILELTIVMVFAKTGIRREELLLLKPEDIDLKNKIIIIERKKRAKNIIRFIDLELEFVLKEYLSWRESRVEIGKCKSPYLFITEHGGRIHKDDINEFIQYHAENIGFHDPDPDAPLEKKMSTHCFRGFVTTYLRRKGMKGEHIQTLLGHTIKKEVWSGFYLDIDMELVKEEYFRCSPPLLVY
ncbi:site-specific integrase [Methanolobus sp. ZRKC2]|uniref:tyrosine-type recombinase/integrase n=1 Tax=Methanolobus sp. ZRKC2 TaxID=3125783 RepID=UPI003255E718